MENKEWDNHQENIPFEERKDPTSSEYSEDGMNFSLNKANKEIDRKFKKINFFVFICFCLIVCGVIIFIII